MDTAYSAAWPVTLAQESAPTDAAPMPSVVAPADNSQAPASSTDGATGTQAPGTTGTPPAPDAGQQAKPGLDPIFMMLIVVVGFFLIMSMTGGRKEKKRKAEMMSNLKKGATVQTVGGVRGTIMDVREDEVVVKVDESSNTRIRFAKSAISSVTNEA